MDGEYRYCFSNKMSSMTTKIVMFNMEVSESPAEPEAGVFMFLFLIKQNMTKYFWIFLNQDCFLSFSGVLQLFSFFLILFQYFFPIRSVIFNSGNKNPEKCCAPHKNIYFLGEKMILQRGKKN